MNYKHSLILIFYICLCNSEDKPKYKRFTYNNQEYSENDIFNQLFGSRTKWQKQLSYLTEDDFKTLQSSACPEQIHLSLGNITSQMIVMWATRDFLTTLPFVRYGTDSLLIFSETGATATFYSPFEFPSGARFLHRAVLQNLIANTTYYYQIICEKCQSEVYSFRTFPAGEDWISSFLVYGDMGRVPTSPILKQLKYEVHHHQYTAILHSGDFAYDMATDNGMMGDAFMNQIQDIATKLPYMTCPGNHEMFSSLKHYLHRFAMPGSEWPMKSSRMWYSMNIGKVHFISYSTEVYFFTCNGSSEYKDQYAWLQNDLREANDPSNRILRPWIIAFGHRPMYCSNTDFDDCTYNTSIVRFGLEDLFFINGVDLIIQAHEHSYERLWPLYDNRLWGKNYTNPQAPVHLIAGAAGCNENFGVCIDPIIKSRGEWSAFHTWLPGLYGYGRLRIVNNTHLNWQQVLGVNGQIIDEFWLTQEQHGPFKRWWKSELDTQDNESYSTLSEEINFVGRNLNQSDC